MLVPHRALSSVMRPNEDVAVQVATVGVIAAPHVRAGAYIGTTARAPGPVPFDQIASQHISTILAAHVLWKT